MLAVCHTSSVAIRSVEPACVDRADFWYSVALSQHATWWRAAPGLSADEARPAGDDEILGHQHANLTAPPGAAGY